MAHFIGKVQGARGQASRLGHAKTGLQVQAQGWAIGGRVTVKASDAYGDTVSFYLTSGSSDVSGDLLLSISEKGELYIADKLKNMMTPVSSLKS